MYVFLADLDGDNGLLHRVKGFSQGRKGADATSVAGERKKRGGGGEIPLGMGWGREGRYAIKYSWKRSIEKKGESVTGRGEEKGETEVIVIREKVGEGESRQNAPSRFSKACLRL